MSALDRLAGLIDEEHQRALDDHEPSGYVELLEDLQGAAHAARLEVQGKLLDLYTPNVRGGPNFAPANYNRGANRILAKAITGLDLLTEEELRLEFARRDAEHQARTDAAIARANARIAEARTG